MMEKVRLGVIGLGRRGTSLIDRCLSEMKDVELRALCDLNPAKLEAISGLLKKKDLPEPKCTRNYRDLTEDPELDAIIIATGWNDRLSLAADSMRAGKYTAIEVGCAYDLSECWNLLDIYERTGTPLMMLENCCYCRREMMVLRLVREGLFGELVHCSGGYHHYLPEVELFMKKADGSVDTDHYRLAEYANRNLDQYPTHELGPISKFLNINRGNRMLTLSSFASKARGLRSYIEDHVEGEHPFRNAEFRQGDIMETIITCANGETIRLSLDTTVPRPFYSRELTVRGTRGMCVESARDKATYFLDGMEEGVFNNEQEFFEKYDHPLHREYVALGAKGGHGGVDWLVLRAFIESVKRKTEPPIDIYDTLTWLAIGPLSEQSVALGGAPVSVPDFTKGRWFRREAPAFSKYSLELICEDPDTPIV